MTTIGYLGPEGTFTHVALKVFLSEQNLTQDLADFDSFYALFEALGRQEVSSVFMPIENSLGGDVFSVLDGLRQLEDGFFISGEAQLRIEQSLLGVQDCDPERIGDIYAHEQSVMQCRRFLQESYPEVTFHYCSSNAVAAEKVSQLPQGTPAACIGHVDLAGFYPLTVLKKSIQDVDDNFTRFVMISSEQSPVTGMDKSSFVFSAQKDQPGSLSVILQELSSRGINLTRITSRPSRQLLGEYIFFIDCEGHCLEESLKEGLSVIESHSSYFKFLGSYARGNKNA